MIDIDYHLKLVSLKPKLIRALEISGEKIKSIHKRLVPGSSSPVFTVNGIYQSQQWTEWTQGFQYGSAILQFDASGEESFLAMGRDATKNYMSAHISNTGVHDHGFNNISTYGNLLRLMNEGLIPYNEWEKSFYELALKASGAVQASRWTNLKSVGGYIYSFNGPHSLFADTIRSLRSLAIAHQLNQVLMGEGDEKISLLDRLIIHSITTSYYNVYFGEGRDIYDVRGRVAHESIFNINNGSYRCPSTQQGYSPFTTWTRGLAWIICGFGEQLEFLESLPNDSFMSFESKEYVLEIFRKTAEATADYYINYSPSDGIPYWDTGAPGLLNIKNYLQKPADPFNDYEPVDSSAAVIAAQGFIRLGNYFLGKNELSKAKKYLQTGLTIADKIFTEPYLSENKKHEGFILHSVYHRPHCWDNIPTGSKIPNGESTMWGDYHARELALSIIRIIENKTYYTFFLK